MGMDEIIAILIVAILVLGPDKLLDAIVQITKIIKAIKRSIDDAKAGIGKEIRIKELRDEVQKYQGEFSPSNGDIRRELNFEEFDDLKRDILDKTKADLTFDSREKETLPQNPTGKASV